jgi:uncharacterized membrane protein YkvA (DUF1232 family)
MTDDNSSNHWLEKPPDDNAWRDLVRQIKLFWRLLKDRRVPIWIKAIPALSLVYLAAPVDLVPDIFVGLGQLDDLAVLALGFRLFVSLAPPDIVREHMSDLIAAAGRWKIIDGEAELGEDAVAPAAEWMVIDGEAEPVDDPQS